MNENIRSALRQAALAGLFAIVPASALLYLQADPLITPLLWLALGLMIASCGFAIHAAYCSWMAKRCSAVRNGTSELQRWWKERP